MTRVGALRSTLLMVVSGTVILLLVSVALWAFNRNAVPMSPADIRSVVTGNWFVLILPTALAVPYYFQLPKGDGAARHAGQDK